MARQHYIDVNFRKDTLVLINIMNQIVEEYQREGYRLTVRQLYYQMVARGYIENTERSYKRITGIVNDARMAGLMDWDVIEDRTREFVRRQRWESGEQILRAASSSYHQDMWENQQDRVFVIVEKEALVGVLERVCNTYDIPVLAARGYPSGTVLREFVIGDILPATSVGQRVTILHLGDHDPSGIDMTRDLEERIALFSHNDFLINLDRIALTMDQIDTQKPPPNPAKSTDARFKDYRRKFGDESWELDALPPSYINNLVREHVDSYIDNDAWEQKKHEIADIQGRIISASKNF